jgi:hypothetical protein
MTIRRPNTRGTTRDGGYALLMVMFIAALMMAVVMTAAPKHPDPGEARKRRLTDFLLLYARSGKF